jgi:hypothetical protein
MQWCAPLYNVQRCSDLGCVSANHRSLFVSLAMDYEREMLHPPSSRQSLLFFWTENYPLPTHIKQPRYQENALDFLRGWSGHSGKDKVTTITATALCSGRDCLILLIVRGQTNK